MNAGALLNLLGVAATTCSDQTCPTPGSTGDGSDLKVRDFTDILTSALGTRDLDQAGLRAAFRNAGSPRPMLNATPASTNDVCSVGSPRPTLVAAPVSASDVCSVGSLRPTLVAVPVATNRPVSEQAPFVATGVTALHRHAAMTQAGPSRGVSENSPSESVTRAWKEGDTGAVETLWYPLFAGETSEDSPGQPAGPTVSQGKPVQTSKMVVPHGGSDLSTNLKVPHNLMDHIPVHEVSKGGPGRIVVSETSSEGPGKIRVFDRIDDLTLRMAGPGFSDTTSGRIQTGMVQSSALDLNVAPGAARSNETNGVVTDVTGSVGSPRPTLVATPVGTNTPVSEQDPFVVTGVTTLHRPASPEVSHAIRVLPAETEVTGSVGSPRPTLVATPVGTNTPVSEQDPFVVTGVTTLHRPASPEVSHAIRVLPAETEVTGSVGSPRPTLVASPVGTNTPVSEQDPFVVTGVTTLHRPNRMNVEDVDAVPHRHNGLSPETEPRSGSLQGLPADDTEIANRLRAYLDFGRRPVRFLREGVNWSGSRQASIGREILNENEVTARVKGGFDSPEVETVTRLVETRALGRDTAGKPRTPAETEVAQRVAATKSPGLDSGGRPQTLPEVEVAPRAVSVRSPGIDTGPKPQTPSAVTSLADGERTGDEATGDHRAGGDTGRGNDGMPGRTLDALDNSGFTEKTEPKDPDFHSALLAKIGSSSEPHISQGNSSERAFDVTVDKVFTSVMERIQAADLERGRVRFEIETDQGQTVRVRLTVDSNVVSARIDAPNEQVRDLLAGHAWELNQRLETEGLIPDNIEFCLAGGREQASNQGLRPGIHNGTLDTTLEEDIENLTMVETETYAFESWA